MYIEDIKQIRNTVKKEMPLIHSITNPIAINECANAVLALGARPIMAEHPKEVKKITQSAKALNLNLGNITDARLKSIKIAAKTAYENNIPIVLDLVGIGCSDLRKKYAKKIIKSFCPTVIKGNYSEIYVLGNDGYLSSGVDSDESLSIADIEKRAVYLARKFKTIVLATGAQDIICDGEELIHILNGTPRLSQVTGTGCMLGCIAACFLSAKCHINAVALACVILGICGELSETKIGNGSFMVNLMDNLTTLADETLKQKLKMEVRKIEEL